MFFFYIERQSAPAPTVDVDEQRKLDMEQYKRLGAVRKRLIDEPGYDRNLKGPKLPPHGLERPTTASSNIAQTAPSYNQLRLQRPTEERPTTSTSNATQSDPSHIRTRFRKPTELEKQREIDKLRNELREAINSHRGNPNPRPNNNNYNNNNDDDHDDADNNNNTGQTE